MSISKLPDSVLSVVCSEWIEFKNVGKLDTSMTNKEQREHFLKFLSSSNLAFYVEPVAIVPSFNHKKSAKFENWVKLRGVYFRSFSTYNSSEFLEKYSLQDLLKVRSLNLCGHKDDKAIKLINLCHGLTSLIVSGDDSVDLEKVDVKILQNLTTVPHYGDISFLAEHCRSLTKFTLFGRGLNRDGEVASDSGADSDDEVMSCSNDHLCCLFCQ